MYQDVLDTATGDADEATALRAYQRTIDSGEAWVLDGSWGRAAMACIDSGLCALGLTRQHDYWGNTIPSRFDVVPGTKGSVEWVRAHGNEVPTY